jgi:hypothetical protein
VGYAVGLGGISLISWIGKNSSSEVMSMTVKEFIQSILLVFCIMATGIVLPLGVVAGSASHDTGAAVSSAGPVFIFEETR